MTEKMNEVPPAAEPATQVESGAVPPATPTPAPAPVGVKERRRWLMPLVSSLVVVVALLVGGVGGYAIAAATDAGRPGIQHGAFPGGPGQQGPQGGWQGPRGGSPEQNAPDDTQQEQQDDSDGS